MSFQLRSAPNKKPITVQTYEEAQALRVLCFQFYDREIEIEGEIPDEFDLGRYARHRLINRHPQKLLVNGKEVMHVHLSTDLVILGLDLANFESVDYTSLLQPYIADNAKLVDQYRAGNEKALNSLMGKFLKDHKGHDAKFIKDALISMLS